jgi:hypothetical protein
LTSDDRPRRATASPGERTSRETVALVLDGCLYALLGGPASSAFRAYLKNHGSGTIVDLLEKPEILHESLQKVFGDSAVILEEFMVRSLQREFGVDSSSGSGLVPTLRAIMKEARAHP